MMLKLLPGYYLLTLNKAICGVLQGKSRVLATHQLHVLNRCDRIIFMQDGKIDEVGTFEQLSSTNRGFMDMMAASSSHEKTKEGEEEEEEAIETLKPKLSRTLTKASEHEGEVAELMMKEERQQDSIKWSVYKDYFKASGTILNVPVLAVLVCLAQSKSGYSSSGVEGPLIQLKLPKSSAPSGSVGGRVSVMICLLEDM